MTKTITPETISVPRLVTSVDGTQISYQTIGSGPGVIVIGGGFRQAQDYLPLARALATSCTVHVMDRRGRGASGAQGADYDFAKEVEDLLAVQAATGARWAFGHSYGGRVALEAARVSTVFERIALYEPAMATEPELTDWIPAYRDRLAVGDAYGAFACFIKGGGVAPRAITTLPVWYLRLVLRFAFTGDSRACAPQLIAAHLAEAETAAADPGRPAAFADVTVPTLLLRGARSAPGTTVPTEALCGVLTNATLETLDKLQHFGPEGKTAPIVAERVIAFLLADQTR
ncbi:alpha/beta hydrolase [Amycolatopsis cynarae]|uniref:Alpha/beta hydrolase n=1 Tax=Amycolatopsis cynarae TaxID=2995223 RepID=A0ABY7AVP2_9PSEU|nr:alpha/beta hydrolase [Amycolatopsis sp. HUAS 11-8]WAL63779.1 alpha/beta hydrolase [Amycolatopsis sp. HUAS 11-8]